jgi:hypothetical protein
MEIAQPELDRFEAVYYSYAVPRSAEILTILGLVFDRIHFPGVHLPPIGFDEEAVEREFQRIAAFQRKDPSTEQLLACMAYAVQQKHLSDFCVFPGFDNGKPLGTVPKEAHVIVDKLEEMLFGPWFEVPSRPSKSSAVWGFLFMPYSVGTSGRETPEVGIAPL